MNFTAMNDTFNFKRFGKYFASDLTRLFSENWLKVLCFGLIPVFGLILSYMFSLFVPGEYEYIGLGTREFFLAATAAIFSVWIPSACYGYVTDKRAGSNYILIPASVLEKTVSVIINAAAIVPAAFLVIYAVSDLVATLVTGTAVSQTLLMNMSAWNLSELFGDGVDGYALISLHISILYFILGAVFFRRGKISKTILVLFGLGVLCLFIMLMVLKGFSDNGFNWLAPLDERVFRGLTTAALVIQAIVLYILIYFRIKKIQQ